MAGGGHTFISQAQNYAGEAANQGMIRADHVARQQARAEGLVETSPSLPASHSDGLKHIVVPNGGKHRQTDVPRKGFASRRQVRTRRRTTHLPTSQARRHLETQDRTFVVKVNSSFSSKKKSWRLPSCKHLIVVAYGKNI
ncbi:hypothetical protein Bbelb_094180 [Branchiostoma belcheri]|nr:hypothetical protein Bbelb_094180 [Branchiostoma belcheri]